MRREQSTCLYLCIILEVTYPCIVEIPYASIVACLQLQHDCAIAAQAMEESYSSLAQKHNGDSLKVAKFQADVDREIAETRLGLRTFPTIVLLPKGSSAYIKYPSERRDVDTLDMWVTSLLGSH